MARMPDRATFTVEIVPEYRQGFKALQSSVVDAGIRAGWYALQVRMKVAYGVELQALSKALSRAEWLARG